jgi:mannose-6-phosphate isomerase-like protein (cupin superfamily)
MKSKSQRTCYIPHWAIHFTGIAMVEIIDVHKKKMEIKDLFKKTPMVMVNNDYVGLAWMNGEYQRHRHNADEFFLVIEGHLTIEVEGKVYELDPGMGVKIAKGEVHRSKSEKMTLVAVFESQGITREIV